MEYPTISCNNKTILAFFQMVISHSPPVPPTWNIPVLCLQIDQQRQHNCKQKLCRHGCRNPQANFNILTEVKRTKAGQNKLPKLKNAVEGLPDFKICYKASVIRTV